MADELDDILNNMRNSSETPPDSLTQRIMASIEAEDALLQQMQSMQSHEELPAPIVFQKIVDQLPAPAKVVRFNKTIFVSIAAALLLMLVIAWFLLQQQNNHSPSMAVNNSTPNALALGDSSSTLSSDSISKHENSPMFFTENYVDFKVNPVGQNYVELVDNDLLYTLMNCNFYVMQPYQSTKKTKLVLDVDQYSSVTVNEKMIRFMNVLYKKNRRQKPTWKARRAKNTLEKWKKKDSKHFDAGADHQPMDIIDVTEFIKENR